MLSLLLVAAIAQVDALPFHSDNTDHGSPTSCAVAALQIQKAVRTNNYTVGPLSTEYILRKAGQKSYFDNINARHGISSGRLLWQYCFDFGSCPLSMCPTPTRRLTTDMHSAALPYRCGVLLGLADVPDHQSALEHLAANYGDCILLTTDGYRAFLLIGIDEFGNGIWLDFYSQQRARLQYLDYAAGNALWNDMLYGNDFTADNYLTVFTMRSN